MTPPRLPPRSLRVGVTGARALKASQLGRISRDLTEILTLIQQEMLHPGQTHCGQLQTEAGARVPGSVRLLTALARGADRLAAEQAIPLGYELFVPMPFQRQEYERDCSEPPQACELYMSPEQNRQQFDRLLAVAGEQFLEFDGTYCDGLHCTKDGRPYQAVGRFIVRHSDLVIAIWDEQYGGVGGTGDIVNYAASVGVPVWWIHATSTSEPRWIADVRALRDTARWQEPAKDGLRAHLASLFQHPLPIQTSEHWASWFIGHDRDHTVSPMQDFVHAKILSQRAVWRSYAFLTRLMSGLTMKEQPEHLPTRKDVLYWANLYKPADELAAGFASRYRSTYVLLFILAIVIVVVGVVATMAVLPFVLTCFELFLLILVFCIVINTIAQGWHERFIECRLLAELCRKQQTLTYFGWALAHGSVRRLASQDRLAWVAWLFAAYQRAAPLPTGKIGGVAIFRLQARKLGDLLDQQVEYHTIRGQMAKIVDRRFGALAAFCFVVVAICVAIQVGLLAADGCARKVGWFGGIATIFAGISAALTGLRAYAEFELLAEDSEYMQSELAQARSRLEEWKQIEAPWPLASQDIAHEAAKVTTLMLQDLDGWSRLFRVKAVDTG